MDAATSELVGVLGQLEAHWHMLDAELAEIANDIDSVDACRAKYGEYFAPPLERLRELKRIKKHKMMEILKTMEGFSTNLEGGKTLIASLENHPVAQLPEVAATPVASAVKPRRTRHIIRPVAK